ncbi:MAG: Gfo/Idh/MocA family oxidoreductase, partial [Planctomycetota bacterium]
MRVVVVGARRARQGIGAFVAEALVGCGCEVGGVVGTTPETVHSAAQPLNANGYLDLAEALASDKPDLVAICSPIEAHAELL